MEKWKLKHQPALDLKYNPEQFVNECLIKGDQVCSEHANQKYMFSEVIYEEEFSYDTKINLKSNRSYDMKFFEICLLTDEHIFRAAKSLEEVEAKFIGKYKWIKSCSQELYDSEREKESWKGNNFNYGKQN